MKKRKPIEIEKFVYKLLTTSTGVALCDSGGIYGRHWQQNQQKSIESFMLEPYAHWCLDFYLDGDCSFNLTIPIFHYLTDSLYLDDICKKFNKLQDKFDNWDCQNDKLCYGVSEQAGEYLLNLDIEFKDYYNWINTYNYDSNLSQVLQYRQIEINGDDYILIQIHQGCDVRGGYTSAYLFKMGYDYISEQFSMLEWNDSDCLLRELLEYSYHYETINIDSDIEVLAPYLTLEDYYKLNENSKLDNEDIKMKLYSTICDKLDYKPTENDEAIELYNQSKEYQLTLKEV